MTAAQGLVVMTAIKTETRRHRIGSCPTDSHMF